MSDVSGETSRDEEKTMSGETSRNEGKTVSGETSRNEGKTVSGETSRDEGKRVVRPAEMKERQRAVGPAEMKERQWHPPVKLCSILHDIKKNGGVFHNGVLQLEHQAGLHVCEGLIKGQSQGVWCEPITPSQSFYSLNMVHTINW